MIALALTTPHIGMPQAGGSSPSGAQVTVAGVILSESSRVSGAELQVKGTNIRAISDSNGAFRLSGMEAGDVVLQVRRVGFIAQDFHMTLAAGRSRRVMLELPRVPQALPDVTIPGAFEKPARYANTSKYDEFFARKANGIGTFITREEIDSKFKARTEELLQTIPGVLIRQHGTQWYVQFQRCGGARIPGSINRGRAPSDRIIVFIDGAYAPEGTDQLGELNPAQIEAIEVYKGPSELPADARGQACGAIYVWLRQ